MALLLMVLIINGRKEDLQEKKYKFVIQKNRGCSFNRREGKVERTMNNNKLNIYQSHQLRIIIILRVGGSRNTKQFANKNKNNLYEIEKLIKAFFFLCILNDQA